MHPCSGDKDRAKNFPNINIRHSGPCGIDSYDCVVAKEKYYQSVFLDARRRFKAGDRSFISKFQSLMGRSKNND